MTPAIKANILSHLALVNHPGHAGDCIRVFCENAHLKSDLDIITCVDDIQSQIKDNPTLMKTILGSQFQFFNSLKLKS